MFGIALVWLLFESGLRSDPIIRILKEIAGTKQPKANLAAKKLLDQQAEYLLIVREPRGPTKTPLEKPQQTVTVTRQSELLPLFEQYPAADFVIVSVGYKFEDIRKRMEILF